MKMLIDIGNSRTKWAVTSGEKLLQQAFFNDQLADYIWPEEVVGEVDKIYLASVASKQYTRSLIKQLWQHFDVEIVQIDSSSKHPDFENGYQAQEQLGVDRWLGVIGARQLVNQGDLIVVDAGTAVNIEWLDLNNIYQGGVIVPGLKLMHQALVGNAAGIDSERDLPKTLVGKNTLECVSSGVVNGVVGAIERVVRELAQQIDRPVTVILAGGATQVLLPWLGELQSKYDCKIQAELVLHGLLSISER